MIFQSKYDLDDNRAVIRRLHRGDMACFEACYKFYYRGLCSFASRWVPVSTAEDIVQDAMLYIWENRDKLLEELSLKGLLFMIVRNKAFDRIAHRQVRQRVHVKIFLPLAGECAAGGVQCCCNQSHMSLPSSLFSSLQSLSEKRILHKPRARGCLFATL